MAVLVQRCIRLRPDQIEAIRGLVNPKDGRLADQSGVLREALDRGVEAMTAELAAGLEKVSRRPERAKMRNRRD